MKELEYPFDAGHILANKRKIRQGLLQQGPFVEKKVSILGGSTTAGICQMMELFLMNQGIRPSFYESEFNHYYEDAVFPNQALDNFGPDIIYIHTSNRNILEYPGLDDDTGAIDGLLNSVMKKYQTIWDSLTEKYHCPIIQNNFEMPLYRLLGNKDASDIHGAVNFLSRLNLRFYEYAQAHENFFICDINYISADYGLKEWSDPFYWYMYKYALNVNAIPYLAFNVANIIKSIFGKNKKGLVLDLDNTLWGGVVGDDGVENLKLGPEEPGGQVYTEFQKYIKAHKQLGVVLNIASKNDKKNAVAGLNHPDSELSPDDFIVIKANWDSKDRNFIEIAETLNVLPESLVFVDDNPAERHMVTEQIPAVSAPEIGESHQYIVNIDRSGFFEMTAFSEDDRKRNEMYKENARRNEVQAGFADYGEYLKSLEMKAAIKPFEAVYMARIAQLTNKSNQFNLTTKRYTQTEIEEISGDSQYITLYGRLKDKFGDNGVVSVVIGRMERAVCHIELWLMSCRVLKRGMECAMMDELVKACRENEITQLRGYYYPTAKNAMVKGFYKEMGFEKTFESESGSAEWSFALTEDYGLKNKYIEIMEVSE